MSKLANMIIMYSSKELKFVAGNVFKRLFVSPQFELYHQFCSLLKFHIIQCAFCVINTFFCLLSPKISAQLFIVFRTQSCDMEYACIYYAH